MTTSTFKADGTVSGPLANGKMQSGTWRFSDDRKMLLITGYTPHTNWVIDELTSTSLKVHDDGAEAGSYALKAVWHAVPNRTAEPIGWRLEAARGRLSARRFFVRPSCEGTQTCTDAIRFVVRSCARISCRRGAVPM